MSAVGLTDHGTVAGIIQFLKECRKQKIKPILGMEAYFCRNRFNKSKELQPDGKRGNRHLNVIAKNFEGYQNLCTLAHKASIEGYYYDARIDFELLNEYKDGLIISSACLSNIVNWNLSRDRYDKAKQAATMFKDIFKEDFYLEMMYHGIDEEAKILPEIQKLSKELDIKIIVSNDSHYIEKSDAEFHEILVCVNTDRLLKDPKRLSFPYNEFYFKSKEEMYKLFGHVPSAMQNTLEIAEKCDYEDLVFVEDGGPMRLPNLKIPEEYATPFDYLEYLSWEGLKKCGWDKSQEHIERLKLELNDIKLVWNTKKWDFATYFLIVKDIMQFAKENDIEAGIRGSGYGSLVVRCLGLSEKIDPKNLIWERFLGFQNLKYIDYSDLGLE